MSVSSTRAVVRCILQPRIRPASMARVKTNGLLRQYLFHG